MEDLLAHERAAEQHVHDLLRRTDVPLSEIAAAFNAYRPVCQASIFADFSNNENKEARLWHAHTEGRRYFHKALKGFRKNHTDQHKETRQVLKHFLEFLKHSQKFYREYVFTLNTACGGIPELYAIAHLGKVDGTGEKLLLPRPSPQQQLQKQLFPPELRSRARDSCHRSLIYLGDLARYRASERLDHTPSFAHAVGYYDLAAHLQPFSGLGHHQQAVVALEERNHLKAIFHLYRAIVIQDPHPMAVKNLQLEFDKTNAAWDKGELIQKGPPNDPDASKHALVGWFVRLHSMCYKGDLFRGHEELEREVLSRVANVVQQRPLERVLMRMAFINLAAQHAAGERFQAHQDDMHQQSFLFFFRLNLRTFTTLLKITFEDLRTLLLKMDDHNVELVAKLTPITRRLLPCLRIYNNWLVTQTRMIEGLSDELFIKDSVQEFWPAYAKAVDLVAQAFPVWDLEDVPEVSYLLEEDVETLGFKPVMDDETQKTWYFKHSGNLRPRFSDQSVFRVLPDEEMLQRIKDFLNIGVDLAMNDHLVPIGIRGTRVFFGQEDRIDPPTVRPPQYPEPVAPAPVAPAQVAVAPQKPKPLDYAAVAASGHARQSRPPPAPRKQSSKIPSREAQLNRMVDDLVDDEEGNNPKTPPQQIASNPAVVANGEIPLALQDSAPGLVPSKPVPYAQRRLAIPIGTRPDRATQSPAVRTNARTSRPLSGQQDRLQSVSRLWNDDTSSTPSSSFPNGLPTGTVGSPGTANIGRHSRVTSVSSVRSNPLNVLDPWGSSEMAPRVMNEPVLANSIYAGYSPRIEHPAVSSPLLFGLGGGPWAFRNTSPTNGGHGG